jgi:SAM-dependent methyltransferase
MFDDLTDVYEAMIDWPKRLAHEGPFYRRLFEQCGVSSVVDVACGVGQHAALFHSWNLRVEGADISRAMIDRARTNFGESPGLRWVVRGFDEPIAPAEPFDAAVCVGNSLALAPDLATVERAIRQMLAGVRQGGVIVIHLLNLGHLQDGPCLWQKCRRVTLPQGEALIVKGVHRCGSRGYVELLAIGLPDCAPMRSESSPLLALEARELERMASVAGATEIQWFGGYQGQAYDRQESVDLVMVAKIDNRTSTETARR